MAETMNTDKVLALAEQAGFSAYDCRETELAEALAKLEEA